MGDLPPVGVLALLVVGEEEEASGGVVAVLVAGEAPSSLLLLGEGGLSIKALEEFQTTSLKKHSYNFHANQGKEKLILNTLS